MSQKLVPKKEIPAGTGDKFATMKQIATHESLDSPSDNSNIFEISNILEKSEELIKLKFMEESDLEEKLKRDVLHFRNNSRDMKENTGTL